jgi:hypothetical protein
MTLLSALLLLLVGLPGVYTGGFDPRLAQQLILLSDAAYCGDSRSASGTESLAGWSCPPCAAAAELGAEVRGITIFANNSRAAFGFTGLLRGGEVLVSFRGSVLGPNYEDDADQALLTVPGRRGKVHRGMWDSYSSISTPMLASVRALMGAADPPTQIIVCGHSLGAGQAVYGAYDLALQYPNTTVTSYSFGTPRPGDKVFAATLNATQNLLTFPVTHRADTVPQCGIHPAPCDELALGLHQIATNIWYPAGLPVPGNPSPPDFIVCDGSGEDSRCQDSVRQHMHTHRATAAPLPTSRGRVASRADSTVGWLRTGTPEAAELG